MPLSFSVKAVAFSDGSVLDFDPKGLIVLVGPNNCGKTSTLKEIRQAAAGKRIGPVLVRVTFSKTGRSKELKEWLDSNVALVKDRNTASKSVYSWIESECDEAGMFGYDAQWNEEHAGSLAPFLCNYCRLDDRLADLKPLGAGVQRLIEAYNVLSDAPQNPIHVLLRDDVIEEKVSTLFRKAFGTDLVLNRGAGTHYFLHCGERPVPLEGQDRVSPDYVVKVSSLPSLTDQGHGMRSFTSCLLILLSEAA